MPVELGRVCAADANPDMMSISDLRPVDQTHQQQRTHALSIY